MADGLSVAASIAGLVSLAEAVTRKSYQYIKEAKNAKKEISKLIAETTELFGILHGLHLVACRFDGEDFDRTMQTHHIHSCYMLLDKLDTKLMDSNPSNYADPKREFMKKLAWPFSSTETKEMIGELERQKSTLRLALSVDNMSALLLALSRQELQGAQIVDIRNDTRNLRNLEERKRQKKLLNSLTTVNNERTQDLGIRLRQPGTGVWFLEDSSFKAWLHEDHGKLWLIGMAGAGKTILASTIIQELQRSKYRDNALAYFYCDYKNRETWNHLSVLGSLIKQLASSHDDCLQDFLEFEEGNREDLSPSAPTIKSTEDAINLLHRMSSHFDQTMIIIDGLDEIGTLESSSDRSTVTSVLTRLISEKSSIKTMFLSRRELDLSTILFDHDQVSISAQSSDLALYVGSEIEKRIREKRLRIKNQELKEEIRKRLVDGADGMFRWVSCQMDYLCQLPTDGARRRALEHLPPTLHETYERILERIDGEHNKTVVRRVLAWTMFSKTPLPMKVLLQAVSVDPGSVSIDDDDIYDQDSILTWCSSLLRLTPDGFGFELAHFTVKEFLMDKHKNPVFDFFHLDQNTGDIEIARSCLTYLGFDTFDDIGQYKGSFYLKENMPITSLYQYSAEYWHCHAFGNFDDPELMKNAQILFNPSRTPQFFFWSQYFSDIHAQTKHDDPDVLSMTPLHWASSLALQPLCQWLIENGSSVEMAGGPGSALQCALKSTSLYGRYDGLNRDTRNDDLWRPVARFEVVKLLLNTGAKVNGSPGRDFRHDSPLEIAVRVSDRSLSRLLLNAGAKVTKDILEMMEKERQKNDDWLGYLSDITPENLCPNSMPLYTELALAPENQDRAVLHKVLQDHEQVATSGGRDELGPALRKAAQLGQIASLKMILSRSGMQINAADESDGTTALHHAAGLGQIQAMDLLLQYGSNINQADNLGFTAVHFAVNGGHFEAFQYLKEHGIDITRKSNSGTTLLHMAASGTNSSLLQAIFDISQGSDMEARNDNGETPLMCAASSGSLSIVNFLLDQSSKEDNLTLSSNEGWTCLHFAARSRDEDNIKAFLSVGADVNYKARDCSTPLHVLLESLKPIQRFDDDKSSKSSRSNDSDSDSDDNSVESMDYIDRSRLQRCFQTMISAGADFLALGKDGLNPVHMLCSAAIPPCGKMLKEILDTAKSNEESLDRVLNDQSTLGSTPLHLLMCAGSKSNNMEILGMIDCLLQYSELKIDCINNNQQTPLISLASCSNRRFFHEYGPRVVSNLIDRGASIHLTCKKRRSALHYLLLPSNTTPSIIRSAQILLEFSANPELRDFQGQSSIDILFSKWLPNARQPSDELKQFTLRIIQDLTLRQLEGISSGGYSALSVAIVAENEDVSQALLERGFNSSLRNTAVNRYSALEMACVTGCTQSVAQRLIKNHPDITQLHSNGMAPLHRASEEGRGVLVEELLLHKVDVNSRTATKHTAIHLATAKGKTSIVELLLANGADIEARDKFNWSLTHHAAQGTSNRAVCDLIFKHLKTGWTTSERAFLADMGKTDSVTPFQMASYTQNLGVIEFLLENNLVPDINVQVGSLGFSALHFAAFNCNVALIKFLLAKGADIHRLSAAGETALLIAADNCNAQRCTDPMETIITLLDHGSDAEKKSTGGLTAELAALSRGRKDVVKIIKERSKATKEVSKDDGSDHSDSTEDSEILLNLSRTLQNAIISKNFELSRQLFNSGPTINQKLQCGCTPILVALATEQMDLVKFLLEKKADVRVENCPSHGLVFDRFGPVHWAARLGQSNILQKILERNPPMNNFGIEPIHLAAVFGHTKCLKVLLDHEKAHPNPKRMLQVLTSADTEKYQPLLMVPVPKHSALHLACARGHTTAIDYLLAQGADIELLDGNLGTPLLAAVIHGHLPTIRQLLLRGANMNVVSMLGMTPFLEACIKGWADVLYLLKEFKCETTTKSVWGGNALHHAHFRVVPMLLDWGFDIEAFDSEGCTALSRLIARSDKGGLIALKRYGGSTFDQKFDHPYYGSLLTVACFNGRLKAAELLLEALPSDVQDEYVNHLCSLGSPLYISAYIGSTELVEVLWDYCADIDMIGGTLGTALHAACSTGRVDVVSQLLDFGANLKVSTEDGDVVSAFERARYHPKVLAVLKAHRWTLMKGRRDWRNGPQLLCHCEGQKLWHFD